MSGSALIVALVAGWVFAPVILLVIGALLPVRDPPVRRLDYGPEDPRHPEYRARG